MFGKADYIYKASDVKEVSGLTYRQLNDWESRGAFPEPENLWVYPDPDDRGSRWRKYCLHDLFLIMVLAELKKKFNIPIEKLKFIKHHMTQEGESRLNALMIHVTLPGLCYWLLTDFEEIFEMESELKIKDMLDDRYFHSEDESAYVLLNVTPLIQKLVKLLVKKDIPLSDVYVNMLQADKKSEKEVLKYMRDGDVTHIEILLDNLKVKKINVTEKKDLDLDTIKDLANKYPYQDILIRLHDGKLVSMEQTSKHKKTKAAGS